MDNKTPVADVVAAAAKDAGSADRARGFVRFQLGEGIEKKESDFAAEVAAAAGDEQGRAGRLRPQSPLSSWQRGGARHKGVAALLHSGGHALRMTRPRFNRILLKLSGEALMGPGQFGIDPDAVAGAGRRDRRGQGRRATSCAWSSAAATSSAAWPRQPRASTAPAPITWACWRR